MGRREVDIPIRFSVDQASLRQQVQALNQAENAVVQNTEAMARRLGQIESQSQAVTQAAARGAKRSIEDVEKATEQLDFTVSTLNQLEGAIDDIFTRVGAAGLAIFAPAVLSATQYAESVGVIDDETRRWAETTERLTMAQQEFGRTALEALLPFYETLADIVELINSIDPRILQAGIVAGGALVAVSTIALIGAQITRLVSAVSDLSSALIRSSAIGAGGNVAGGGGAVGVGAAGRVIAGGAVALGGIGLGILGTRAIGQATGDERLQNVGIQDLLEPIKQALILVGVGFIEFGELLAEAFIEIEFVFGTAQEVLSERFSSIEDVIEFASERLRDGFEGIRDALEIAVLGLQKFVLDIPGLGDLAGSLGLNERDINQRLNQLQSGANPLLPLQRVLEEQRQAQNEGESQTQGETAAERRNRRLAEVEENSRQMQESLVDFALGAEEADEATQALTQTFLGLANVTEDQRRALLDQFEQLRQTEIEERQNLAERQQEAAAEFAEAVAEAEAAFYADREQQAEAFYASQAEAERRFRESQAEAASSYESERANALELFARSQAEIESAFYEDRRAALEAFQQEQAQAQEDFRIRQRRAEEDFNRTIQDAGASIDAETVFRARRDFALQQSREREDFTLEQRRRAEEFEAERQLEKEEFEQQQADRVEAFQQQRQQAQDNFEEQRRDAEVAFRQQQQDARTNFEQQRRDAETAFRESQAQQRRAFEEQQREEQLALSQQQAERRAAFVAEFELLVEHNQRTEEEWARHYATLEGQLQQFLESQSFTDNERGTGAGGARGSTEIEEFAQGGYTGDGGLARVHPNEYVLNPSTTSMLESALGGGLTQRGIMNAVTNSRSIGDVYATVNVAGNASGSDVERIRVAVRDEFGRILRELA